MRTARLDAFPYASEDGAQAAWKSQDPEVQLLGLKSKQFGDQRGLIICLWLTPVLAALAVGLLLIGYLLKK
jgi:hypothetical protein